MKKRRLRFAAVPVALAFLASACSTEDSADDADTTEAAADTAGGDTEAPATEAPATEAAATEPATDTASEATEASDDTEAPATEAADTEADGTEADSTEADSTEAEGTTAATEAATDGTDPTATFAAAAVDIGDIDLATGNAELEGTTVTVYGPESTDVEGGSIQDALNVFAEANGMTINYVGAREFEEQVRTQVAGGNPPDIAIFPQPGNVADFAASGELLELPEDVAAAVSENWSEDWLNFWSVDGTLYGVPNKSDLKSLVWYIPSAFEEAGYEVPETYTDFVALTEQMIEDGNTPLCVGVESGPSTGWPFTDWVEELVLRQHGAEVYDQWVAHEIPFNSPEIVDAMQQVADLWNTEGMVYAAGGSIVSTPFGADNFIGLVDGSCMMHRQASFFASFVPDGTEFGTGEGQVSTFYFPSDEGTPVEVGGTGAAAFRDAPEVWAVMEYFGSPEYASIRQQAQTERAGGGLSGFLTAVDGVDTSLFTELEAGFIEILQTGDPARFDASDLMPGEVGSGTFWSAGVEVISGELDAQEAADEIEDSWP
ncbi:MAG: ABC transporter substrate-binding protein [Desertimonas sp.]